LQTRSVAAIRLGITPRDWLSSIPERELLRCGLSVGAVGPRGKAAAVIGREILFADVAVAARSPGAGAVIVDVQAFLDLCRVRTTAATALQQTDKRVLALRRVRRMVRRHKHPLDPLEEIAGDQGFVLALVQPPEPMKVAAVDRILEDLMDLGADERPPGRSVREAGSCGLLRDRLQGDIAGRVPLEQLRNDWCTFWIRLDPASYRTVRLTDWRKTWPG